MRDNLKFYLRLSHDIRVLSKEVAKEPRDDTSILQALARSKEARMELEALLQIKRQAKKMGFIWW